MLTSNSQAHLSEAVVSPDSRSIESQRVTVIEAGKQEKQYWHDLWSFRELLYFLSWRDILVRYKQTVIGLSWSIIRPFLLMIIMTFAFNKVAHLHSGKIPYALFVMAGLLPWQFFSTALSESSMSMVTNKDMISKIYFPRLLIPLSAVVVSFVDAMIGFAIYLSMSIFYHVYPTWRIILLPLLMILTFLPSIGFGLWFAALNVKYRDFRYIVPFIVQFGMYVSPVGYSIATVTNPVIRNCFYISPIAGIIDGWRWALLGQPLHLTGFSTAILTSVAVLVFGIWYFRRTEQQFADLI